MPDAVRIHLASATRVVVLREHHSSRLRDHHGGRDDLADAIDVLLTELDVDYDAEAPVSQGQATIGSAVIKRGRIAQLHHRQVLQPEGTG